MEHTHKHFNTGKLTQTMTVVTARNKQTKRKTQRERMGYTSAYVRKLFFHLDKTSQSS